MYLDKLNEKQKKYFLDLSIGLASEDGYFSDKEKEAIHLLCDEMRIKDRYIAETSVEDAVQFFSVEASPHVQRIVLLELLGIAMADNVYETCERSLITKIAEKFSIRADEVDKMCEAITQLYELYAKFNYFIGA